MKKSVLIAAALMLPILQACETGPSQRVLTTGAAGAILGAGAGMMAGGDDKRNAAIGAAVGAIAGASVGVYMDKQEEKLRQQTAGTGIEVERQGDQIALTMPSGISFQQGSAQIQPAFFQTLNQVAATLNEYPRPPLTFVVTLLRKVPATSTSACPSSALMRSAATSPIRVSSLSA